MTIIEKKENITSILITCLGIFLAGLIGSIGIIIFAFIIGNQTDIFSNIYNSKFGTKVESLYTILFSFLTLFGSFISSIISYKILGSTNPERYKKNNIIFAQISFFQILVYIFVLPIYLFFGGISFENIMYTYIFHILIITFGTNIVLDVLNNYRYILIGIYGSFIGLFISILISIGFFYLLGEGIAKLFALVFLLPIVNFFITLTKKIFELFYYHIYRFTGIDFIGDIFHKIKKEDEDNEKEKIELDMN